MKGFYLIYTCCIALLTTTAWADESYPPPTGPYTTDPYAAAPYTADPYAANPYAADPYTADPYTADPYAADPYAAAPYPADPYPGRQAYPSAPTAPQPIYAPTYGYPGPNDYTTAPNYPQAARGYPPPPVNRRSLPVNPMAMMNAFPSPWGNRSNNRYGNPASYPEPRGYTYGPGYGSGYPPSDNHPPRYDAYAPQGYGYAPSTPNYREYNPQSYPYGHDSYNRPPAPPEADYRQAYPAAPYGAENRGEPVYRQNQEPPRWPSAPQQQPLEDASTYDHDNQMMAPTSPAPLAAVTEKRHSQSVQPLAAKPDKEVVHELPVGETPVFRPLTEEEMER
ncbi:MAG: hypothetical protein ABW166_12150 [Sedimenticola sp.]